MLYPEEKKSLLDSTTVEKVCITNCAACATDTYSSGDISIPGDVFVESDLNGASPQFILTCISTGGPATTVTWTRDNVNIIGEHNETVLNDPVTAQYIHTLTVTTEGEYTCTVANNKPSTASASITLQGIYCNVSFSNDIG